MGGRDHAVVIGASMSGLVAARVLADHFDRVTVVERDRLPSEPVVRSGVPQARHVHVLLLTGARLLERMFPGLDDQLAAAGCPRLDWTSDVWLYNFGAWKPRTPSGLTTHGSSRELLEWTIRGRVAANARVRFLEQVEVSGVVADSTRRRAVGVRLRSRDGSRTAKQADGPSEDRVLEADFVINASGRDAHTTRWLEDLGVAGPPEIHVNSHLGYATRYYRPPDGHEAEWKALVIAATPPASRGGVLMPVDGGRWIVTLAGSAGDYPPTDEEGFAAFVQSLPSPLLADVLKRAMPISSIVGYRRTENVLHDYSKVPRFLEGFVSIGDAVCAFNPVYGQGMTVATQTAIMLGATLREDLDRPAMGRTGLARRYHRRLAKLIGDPWLLATGEDLRYRDTTGADPTFAMRIVRPYLDRVMIVARDDPDAYRTVVEVIHLLRRPRALFRPRIFAMVLRRMLRLDDFPTRRPRRSR
jgi:flavin-dependent dehydrogenase